MRTTPPACPTRFTASENKKGDCLTGKSWVQVSPLGLTYLLIFIIYVRDDKYAQNSLMLF